MSQADKLEIADEMLDAAICLFLDKNQFFASLNLAGVAEELYGKFIRISGGRDIQQELVEGVGKLRLRRGGPQLTSKEWKKIAGHFKNAVKHFDSQSERFIDIEEFNEARSMIGNALSNHTKLDRGVTSNVQRFYEFSHALSEHNSKNERQ